MPEVPNKPSNKPIDIWFGLGAVVVGIIYYWLPKTPTTLIISILGIFLLLIHPIWNFWWIEKSRYRQILFCLFFIVSLFIFAYIVWPISTQGKTEQKTATTKEKTQEKPRTNQSTAKEIAEEIVKNQTPPVLDMFVDQDKILHINNLGPVDISDIQLYITVYKLKAHLTGDTNNIILDDGFEPIRINSDMFARRQFLARGREYNINLTKLSYRFLTFIDLEEMDALKKEKQFDIHRTVYCLRILFRNDVTKQRQVHYLFTNAIKKLDPWDTHGPAPSGAGFLKKYLDAIIKHQQTIYGDAPANLYNN